MKSEVQPVPKDNKLNVPIPKDKMAAIRVSASLGDENWHQIDKRWVCWPSDEQLQGMTEDALKSLKLAKIECNIPGGILSLRFTMSNGLVSEEYVGTSGYKVN